MQKIVVSGASGFVGKAVCEKLAENNFQVIALVRSKSSSKEFKHKNISAKVVDIFDEQELAKAIKGASVFFHFIGTSRKTTDQSYDKMNVESTQIALNSCKKSNVKKFVYLSGLGVSKVNNQVYFRSKRQAEEVIKKSKIDYTIFRPSYLIGKDNRFTNLILNQAKTGKIFVPGSGDYRLQPILVDDFARICVNLVDNKKAKKKIFDLVGPKVLSFKKFCVLVCKEANIKPSFEFVLLEKAVQQAMNSSNPPYSVGEMVVLVSDTFSKHGPLEEVFGLKLTPLNVALRQILSYSNQ